MSPTGHLAIGFTARKFVPEIPLVIFLIAAYAIDLIYFVFLALGLDKFDFDPWSHSLFMAVMWSVFAGFITFIFIRKFKGALVIGLVVFSHWILDIIVWDNIPLFFNENQRIGFGLYNKIGFSLSGMQFDSGTIIATSIEMGMLLFGIAIYIIYLRKQRKGEAKH